MGVPGGLEGDRQVLGLSDLSHGLDRRIAEAAEHLAARIGEEQPSWWAKACRLGDAPV